MGTINVPGVGDVPFDDSLTKEQLQKAVDEIRAKHGLVPPLKGEPAPNPVGVVAPPDRIGATDPNVPPPTPPPKKEFGIADIPKIPENIAKNLGVSVERLGKNIGEAVSHPLDTIRGLINFAATPLTIPYYGYVSGLEDLGLQSPGTARTIREFTGIDPALQSAESMVHRFTHPIETISTDPAGLAADVLSFGRFPKGTFDIPFVTSQGAKSPGLLRRAGDWLMGKYSELMPGVSGEAMKDVIQAGRETGGTPEVRYALKYGFDSADMRDRAHGAVDKLIQQRSQDYNTRMATVKGSNNLVDFNKIDTALDKNAEMYTTTGRSGATKIHDEPLKEVADKVREVIEDWKASGNEFHTVYNMDKLKQKIDSEIGKLVANNEPLASKAEAYVAKIRKSITDSIRDVAPPEYVEAMEGWAKDKRLLENMIKEFKLKDTNTDIQTTRSLQQVNRRSAGVAHAEKENLLREAMEKAGDKTFMAELAASNFHPWLPEGLRKVALGAGLAGGYFTPWSAATGPFMLPRVAGNLGYGFGRATSAEPLFPHAGPFLHDFTTAGSRMAASPTTLVAPQNEQRRRGGYLRTLR